MTGRGRGGAAAARADVTGTYRYHSVTDTWEWSDAVYHMYGFRPGEVVPSAQLVLAHTHAGDRRNAERAIRACLDDGKLFSNLHRLIDAAGHQRWVVIAGEGIIDPGGAVTGIRGYLIDLTVPLTRARSREVARVLHQAADSRAAIEQAKGALMLVYELDAEAAFALLSWHSQHANLKLRQLARRLLSGITGAPDAVAVVRARLDDNLYGLPGTPAPGGRPPARVSLPRGLTAELDASDEVVVLRLTGDINMATGPRLDAYLAGAVEAAVAQARDAAE